jgi:DNA-binding MarR family transcriptional regulator
MEKLGIVVRKRGKEDKRQQIVSLTAKGKAMEEQAYAIIPAGMGKELSACPFQLEDYARFAGELDTIIDTLKKKTEK